MEDRRGVPVSMGNANSLEVYETALRALNCYRGDPVAVIDTALDADPDFVMGHVFRAQVHLTMWERSVVPEIEASLARLKDLDNRSNDRERAHVRALEDWVGGDWDAMRGRFGARGLEAAARPGRPGHAWLDLGLLMRVDLVRAGLDEGRIGVAAASCTACDSERFHSYRRDGPRSGRLLHWIAPGADRP